MNDALAFPVANRLSMAANVLRQAALANALCSAFSFQDRASV